MGIYVIPLEGAGLPNSAGTGQKAAKVAWALCLHRAALRAFLCQGVALGLTKAVHGCVDDDENFDELAAGPYWRHQKSGCAGLVGCYSE